MPHRTTYFFPRQFPERGLDESPKQLLDHEKKKIVNSIKSDTFGGESDVSKKPRSHSTTPSKRQDSVLSSGKHSAVSDLFAAGDKFRAKQKPIAAFCDWLIEKKVNHSGSHRLKPYVSDEDRDLLLPPETAVDQSFDRQVSLPRLSSGSSYAGSLFSGTTLDGNFSSDIKDETLSSRISTKTIPVPRQKEEEEEEEEEQSKEKLAKKSKESYILQLTLAKRLTCLASLVTEPVLASGTETWDAESVSYRLWVHNSAYF